MSHKGLSSGSSKRLFQGPRVLVPPPSSQSRRRSGHQAKNTERAIENVNGIPQQEPGIRHGNTSRNCPAHLRAPYSEGVRPPRAIASLFLKLEEVKLANEPG